MMRQSEIQLPERYNPSAPASSHDASLLTHHATSQSGKSVMSVVSDISSDSRAIMAMISELMSAVRGLDLRMSRMESCLNTITNGPPVKLGGADECQNQGDEVDTQGSDINSDRIDRQEGASDSLTTQVVTHHEHAVNHNAWERNVASTSNPEPAREPTDMQRRVVGLNLTPHLEPDELSYMKAYFPSRSDVFARILVSLCSSIQTMAEEATGEVFTLSIGSKYNRLKRVIGAIANHPGSKVSMPLRSSVSMRLVAKMLAAREDQPFPVVTGYTFTSIAQSNATVDVFRCFQNIILALRKLPEIMPNPSSDIVRMIGTRISTPDGRLDIDVGRLHRRVDTQDELTASSVEFIGIHAYVTARLDGRSVGESLANSCRFDSKVRPSVGPTLGVSQAGGLGSIVNGVAHAETTRKDPKLPRLEVRLIRSGHGR